MIWTQLKHKRGHVLQWEATVGPTDYTIHPRSPLHGHYMLGFELTIEGRGYRWIGCFANVKLAKRFSEAWQSELGPLIDRVYGGAQIERDDAEDRIVEVAE